MASDLPANRICLTFRALGSRNYRLFFLGQGISMVGTWMQRIALGWLVYRLTDSAALLGIVGFASQIPAFILAPFAGVLADRVHKPRLLLITQAAAMVQALILAALVLLDCITVPQIIVLSVLLGCINAFDIPTRQALMVHTVERREDLGNAIALNSAMFNGARMIGPAIAGVLVALVGEGWCFFINGISYLAVLAALLSMRLEVRANSNHVKMAHGLREGFNYVRQHAPIRSVLLLIALVSFAGMPYGTLMPLFARDILGGNAQTLGYLMGAAGVGAIVGAVILASRSNSNRLESWIAAAPVGFGLAVIAFGMSSTLWLSLALMPLVGCAMMIQIAAGNTMVQCLVDDDKRGRVMSFYTMAFMGSMPLGSLLAGTAAHHIGGPWTLAAGGMICILGAGAFALHLPRFRADLGPAGCTGNVEGADA